MERNIAIFLVGFVFQFVLISSITTVIACNKGYGGGLDGFHGWGGAPAIILPKPTLLPKLKQAYIDGKLGVNYHKIVGPSLKPLPYKKGVGWIYKHWVPDFHGPFHGHHGGINSIGHHEHFYDYHNYHIGVGKTGILGGSKGIGIGKNIGYGKGLGFGKGIGYGKGYGYGGGYGYPIAGGPGIGHLPVGPIGPVGPVGITNTVSHESVNIVGKGVPGLHHPPGLVGPHGIPH